MDIAVLGAGAIGSALGARLSHDESITLIGHDNDHLRAIQDGSLSVSGPGDSKTKRPVSVTTDHRAVETADLLVLAVKSYDTKSAMKDIDPFVGDRPVLTLQNGLGNIEHIGSVIGTDQVIGGTTTMGASLPEPGHVRIENLGQTRIGRPWGVNGSVLDRIESVFEGAGFHATVVPDIRQAIWEKVLINAGINPITALGQVPNGQLQAGVGRELLRATIREAQAVAEAEGYPIENPVAKATAVLKSTADNRSSMLRDIEAGNRTEIDALNGAIVERAESHGISVPVNRTITAAIELLSDD
ncbi:MAG: ketopantoate reductase family protein [Halodesulfurarchaeum sp.]